jgi:PhoH-like ATPase
MVKNYLLDTNILLQSPASIEGFEDNNVWLSATTLQELDMKKTGNTETGYAARECCRILDRLRTNGDFLQGIPLWNGGTLFVEPSGVSEDFLPKGFRTSAPDNRIISTGLFLMQKRKGEEVILVTNDISMRVNASVCGLKVESYRNAQIESEDAQYKGYQMIECTDGEMINQFYKEKGLVYDGKELLLENEYVVLKCGQQSAMGIYQNGEIKPVQKQTLYGWIKPMNVAQTFAMHALMAPPDEIPLVILLGPSGTSKTFLSLAAGLTQIADPNQEKSCGRYRKILISRPNVETAEKGFGSLPGI